MTIESLCKMSAAQLEAMTDQQLLTYFTPFLKVTRPELVEKPTPSNIARPSYTRKSQKDEKLDRAKAALAQLGLELKL